MAATAKQTTTKPTKRSKRPWTDADKERAIAVYTTTGNLSKTSRQTGVPISTLRGWLAEVPAEEVQQARLDAQAEFVIEAWKAVTAHVKQIATDEVVKKTAAVAGATTVGILIDKIQLITGQATAIQEQRGQVTQRHEYEVVQRITTDPEARELARNLFRRGLSTVGEDLGGGRPE